MTAVETPEEEEEEGACSVGEGIVGVGGVSDKERERTPDPSLQEEEEEGVVEEEEELAGSDGR